MISLFKKLFGETKAPAKPEKPLPAQHIEKTRDTAKPEQNLFERDYRFIAVDVETANTKQHSICQIGLAMVENDGTILTASHLINPECPFDTSNVKLHGIDAPDVADKPTFPEFMENARAILERHPLIQHSNFDAKAFEMACRTYDLPKLDTKWIDSVQIARKAWPEFKEQGGHGLANLKEKLGLEFRHHDAEEDARAAATVVLMAEKQTGKPFTEIITKRKKTYKNNFEASVAAEGNPEGPLHGHIACFTGKLTLSRADAAKTAANAGISVQKNVTKKTTLLIVGDQDLNLLAGHSKSSKHRRAEELIAEGQKIRIMGETEFIAMIESNDSHKSKVSH